MRKRLLNYQVILGCLLLAAGCAADTTRTSPPAAQATTLDANLETETVMAVLQAKETADPIRTDSRWQQPEKIHALIPKIAYPPQIADFESWLGENLGAELIFISSPAELARERANIESIVGFCGLQREVPKLHWMQSISAGIEGCAANAQINNDRVIVTNGAATSGPAIAEWVIGSMFMMQRHFPEYYRKQQNAEWASIISGSVAPGYEIAGRSILIVGLGGIGKQIAWRAKGLGMRVVATRNSSREGPDYVDYVGLPDELLTLAKSADVVVNSAPLTDKTRNLYDADFFNAMPKDAMFINIGRGGSVVQEDLIQALKSGAIRAAALDVTTPEPLPKDSELWQLPNVFITPHQSSLTYATLVRRWVFIRENMRRFVKGDQVFNLVDFNKGY